VTGYLAAVIECDGPDGEAFCPTGAVCDTGATFVVDGRDTAVGCGWWTNYTSLDLCPACRAVTGPPA